MSVLGGEEGLWEDLCLSQNYPQNRRGGAPLQTFKTLATRGFQVALALNSQKIKHLLKMGLFSTCEVERLCLSFLSIPPKLVVNCCTT